MNPSRNASGNLLNRELGTQGSIYSEKGSGQLTPKYFKARVKEAPKDNGMGSILAYSNAGTYREDTSRMGGVTLKTG